MESLLFQNRLRAISRMAESVPAPKKKKFKGFSAPIRGQAPRTGGCRQGFFKGVADPLVCEPGGLPRFQKIAYEK